MQDFVHQQYDLVFAGLTVKLSNVSVVSRLEVVKVRSAQAVAADEYD